MKQSQFLNYYFKCVLLVYIYTKKSVSLCDFLELFCDVIKNHFLFLWFEGGGDSSVAPPPLSNPLLQQCRYFLPVSFKISPGKFKFCPGKIIKLNHDLQFLC